MNPKNKINTPAEQKQNHKYREHVTGYQVGEGSGGQVKKVKGLRSTNRELQNSYGDIKYSIGNRVAQEHICVTHGHEQRCGDCLRDWDGLVEGGKGGNLGQL